MIQHKSVAVCLYKILYNLHLTLKSESARGFVKCHHHCRHACYSSVETDNLLWVETILAGLTFKHFLE